MLNNNYSRSIHISKPAVQSERGIVTANHKIAAQTGAQVLAAGGSAVDAAIATSFMIGVCEPWMSGIGGCGQMLIYSECDGQVQSIDFGTVSPTSLDRADFPLIGGTSVNLFNWPAVKDDRNVTGARSICVPTLVRAMEAAHKLYGRIPWAELLRPAIEQARQGLAIDAYASLFIASAATALRTNAEASSLFLDPDGLPPTIAWSSNNSLNRELPKLAETLQAIAVEGSDIFYRGEIAQNMVEDVRALGGYLSMKDMQDYQPIISSAGCFDAAGAQFHIAPELNAGPTLSSTFGHLASGHAASTPRPEDTLELAQALQNATKERLTRMGHDGDARGEGCTTHFNTADRHGNMVVVTQTLLSVFGSKVVSGKTGILMNNGTLWFDPVPGRPNSIAPGKRPLSNMCPVIAIRDAPGRAPSVLGIGAAGGRKILPAVAQILWRTHFFRETLEEAFHAPRFDIGHSDSLAADFRFGQDVIEMLQHEFTVELGERHFYPYAFACPCAIHRENGINTGCSEVYSLWGDTVAESDVSQGNANV